MGAILCCLRGPDDEAPGCCLCLPWPFLNNDLQDSGPAARQRADTRVAPVEGRVPLAGSTGSGQDDAMNTFRCPPRPLPYDDPQSIHQMEQHPLVAGHDKGSTRFRKSFQLEESNNSDISSGRAAHKAHMSTLKAQSHGQKIVGTQVDVPSEFQDDCPICLEEYDYENPKIELQCNHNFHLGCIYEWMERSQSCPLCAKVMLFNEEQ
ncbi:E3 ubiquitin-protein ligase At3g02290 [Lolium perenne]|uniref:E3 ubiquitin-protein ligase At3g02290 n=1 Tax=Lolium perenne TaxID=4522 RepID=UPI0021F68D64|nr:E3 ubiquitin-protein ligase At3g02290-like [Lolium perenne]